MKIEKYIFYILFFIKRSLRKEKYPEQLDELFASAHVDIDSFSICFTCCEALLSHGYSNEAYKLARILAQQLLQVFFKICFNFKHFF